MPSSLRKESWARVKELLQSLFQIDKILIKFIFSYHLKIRFTDCQVFFVVGFLFFAMLSSVKAGSTLSLEIKSSKPDTAQVYYDDGTGFSEANSAKAKLKGNGDFEQIEFTIPVGKLKALRFDPLEKSGSVELRSVKLPSGDKQFLIPLDQVTPVNQIAKTEIRQGVLLIETLPGATDPQLNLPIIKNSSLMVSSSNAEETPSHVVKINQAEARGLEMKGCVDFITINGKSISCGGWFGRTGTNEDGLKSIIIRDHMGLELFLENIKKTERKDVSQVFKQPEWINSGWVAEGSSEYLKISKIENIEVYALMQNNSEFKLQRSNSPEFKKYSSNLLTATNVIFFILIPLFLIFLAVYVKR